MTRTIFYSKYMPFSAFTVVLIVISASGVLGQANDIVKIDQLTASIKSEKEKVQVVNFWATWCGPCIKELPIFEQLNEARKDIRVRLVSLDLDLDPNPDKVRNFATRKKLKAEIVMLDERDPSSFIDKIDKSWSGALPATLVINNKNGKRRFINRELKEGELDKLIKEVQ
jgi:thiol-disulfide isomerase/thioredoxin